MPDEKYQTVLDGQEEELTVGDRVTVYGGEDTTAKITKITDFDVDYDDEIMRPAMSCPIITVEYDDGTTEEWKSWLNVGDKHLGDPPTFICDDLEKVT